jgi:hypothetical protein
MTPLEARAELLTKTMSTIHEDSALGWTARALAAKQLFQETNDLKWAVAFTDLRHEALEHAALSESPAFLDVIRTKLQGGAA